MKNHTRVRLARILAEDKEELNRETQDAALKEFQRVADEFFETQDKVKIVLTRQQGDLQVSLSFRAVRAKNFTALK